ncbi:MAG: inosine/xanthosine triphosphatase [Trueperaceae bacterium]
MNLRDVRTVAVGSTSPAKVGAIREAVLGSLADLFPAAQEVRGVATASGVPAQPIGDAQTRKGAQERARAALERVDSADLAFGLEGGVAFDEEGAAWAFSWVAAIDRQGTRGVARSAAFALPDELTEQLRDGAELGDAIDRTFGEHRGETRLKDGPGAVGLLTAGRIVRAELFRDAVVLALVPWLRQGGT